MNHLDMLEYKVYIFFAKRIVNWEIYVCYGQ